MTTLAIMGRSFEIAPYKLGALKLAAPHIDAMNAIARDIGTMEGAADSAVHMLAVLAIGLQKLDPTLTAEYLEEQIGFDEMAEIGRAVKDLLAESGLAPKGEAQAPSAPETAEGALESKSEALSAS